ncbi:TM2 domain protein [Anatilimnocola aggregata]|uniref:TM2 domain protein n=1 Tax=Anatilimnocola aggregata TaxID=2528021 RepID=A0A517Y780_9BACT|nr:TM2 domain-containing protein [Anatilimnocola aggregata]QDU25992.1 TM2 domain protein [Anatilimnocola aggregata]
MDRETVESYASKKVAAGVCGIVIGSLGIHKFVLGKTQSGLVMLLFTVLTCGIGGAVMGVIGLVEGILYLTKNDNDFYRIYYVEGKEWF